MATTLSSLLIRNYSLIAKSTVTVRMTASATGVAMRSTSSGYSVGTPTGKIVNSGNDNWIEVLQIPYNNGFVKSTDVRILNDKNTEVYMSVSPNGTAGFQIFFSANPPGTTTTSTTQNISETQAKSELEQFIVNEQNVFSVLGRCQALLTKIPTSVNVTAQINTINTLTDRYNKRQNTLNNAKGFKAAVANFNLFRIIKTSNPSSSVNGFGALPVALIVPIVKWGLVGVSALAIWLIVRNNKSEGLSDLRLSKDVEGILSQKLSEEERKRVINEFEQQRQRAFEEGKKNSDGTLGQIGTILKWGAIGIVVAIVAKKVFSNKS